MQIQRKTTQKIPMSLGRLCNYCRAVAQHLSDPLHDLRRVVSDADDAVGAHPRRVLSHALESMRSGLLTQITEQCDITSDERLQTRANCAQNRSRPYNDSPHDSEVALDAITIQREGRRDHVSVDCR